MTQTVRMTDRWLQSLKVDGGRHEFCDAIIPGLRLRVTRRSKKWSALVGARGERRRVPLGDYPALGLADARTAADGIVRGASLGVESGSSKDTTTIKELCEAYIDRMRRAGQPSARQYDGALISGRYSFCRFVERQLGENPPAARVTPDLVTDWLRETFERAPGQMRECRTYLHAVFVWALKADYDPTRPRGAPKFGLSSNPVAATARGPSGKPRSKVISERQISYLWHLLPEIAQPRMVSAIRLLISMGGLRISEISVSKKEWYRDDWLHLPETKNGKAHAVPLTEHAKIQWRAAMDISSHRSLYLFPNERDVSRSIELTSIGKAAKRVVDQYDLEKFQLRDLRRSMKTHLLERELVDEREIDIWHNHGQNADVAWKHYTWAEYRKLKLRVAATIDELLEAILPLDVDLPAPVFGADQTMAIGR